jgi:hypothetical protein
MARKKKARKAQIGDCEMMVFCPQSENPRGERECGDPGVAECRECGLPFCGDPDHGNEIEELCRDCREGEEQ